ncbi:MAG: 1-phosphofructokinase [Clostridia bacterium]|nr:1-phosphofructokinase [Clostridia bacterium]
MIYTVTMNPSLDYIMDVNHFTPGLTNRSTSQQIFPGGKGINVSVILHRLGQPTVATGFIAGFTGEEIRRSVEEMGISTYWLPLKQGMSRINVKLRGDVETEVNGVGPVVTGEDFEKLLSMVHGITAEDYLVLSGSLSAGMRADSYYQLAKIAGEKGAKVVVDAAGESLRAALKAKPFLIKPNRQELGEYFGGIVDPADVSRIAHLAGRLQQEGANNVLVSLGSRGSVLLDENGKVHTMPSAKGMVVNTVGAGDSMIAGFITGMISHKDYSYALRLGTACGGATSFGEDLADAQSIGRVLATLPAETLRTL